MLDLYYALCDNLRPSKPRFFFQIPQVGALVKIFNIN